MHEIVKEIDDGDNESTAKQDPGGPSLGKARTSPQNISTF